MSIYSEHFKTVFSTKKSIQSLRNMVLELAIQGKLVEQDASEEPTSELLKSAQAEKEQLIKEKKIKKEKALPGIGDDEIPFEIPESWEWVRLGAICSKIGSGSTPAGGRAVYKDSGIKFIRSQNVYNDGLRLDNVAYISDEINGRKSGSQVFAKDLLLNITGASIGRCAIVPDDFDVANINQHVLILRIVDERIRTFVHTVMCSPYIFDEIMRVQVGGTKEGLSGEKAKKLIIPIPPLTEQNRIVVQIEKLMAEIDQLEKYLQRKERLEEALPKAVVSAVSNCKNEEELKVQLGLIIEHFAEVFQTPESLQELRNVILQLGIQGKLVPQNPMDAPVSELLKHIQAEKALLIKEWKLKKEKSLPEIEKDKVPFEIPNSWEWVRLGDVSNQIHYGYTASAMENGDAKLLRITDIQKGRVNWESVPMCEINTSKMGQYLLGEKDIVVARTGGTVGKSFIIQNISGHSVFASYLIRIVLTDNCTATYVYQYLNSPFYWEQIQIYSQGTGQPNVNAQNLKNLMVPFPPLDEQNRIVKKIESLFVIIDKLEKEIQRKQRIVKSMTTI